MYRRMEKGCDWNKYLYALRLVFSWRHASSQQRAEKNSIEPKRPIQPHMWQHLLKRGRGARRELGLASLEPIRPIRKVLRRRV